MSAASSEKSAAATRGRSAASKPLNSSNKVASSSRPARPPSASSIASSKSSVDESTPSPVKAGKSAVTNRPPSESDNGFKVTKLSSTTVTLQTTWTPKPASERTPPQPPAAEQQTPTVDPLQVAAQVYPWTYMTSTLDACFKDAEVAATADLATRANQLSTEESEIADQRTRLEAERSIEFFDELASDPFAREAPAIMQSFHSHGDACTRIETEALKLAMHDAPEEPEDEPLKVYQDMLHNLEKLQDEATRLQDSITQLTQVSVPTSDVPDGDGPSQVIEDASSARSQVNGVFAACLPILRARIANLSMAQELIDSALENVSLGLRMESMGLTD
ncbi:hypothetical protein CPB84DRAFT_1758891 [Gymnopilus junonius]|uniref:Uncharacterized protein n=1 Tax=Gymnopilus junonius TaxID=109634 RepID=A0A9P5P2C1_GYMJU|nr:hypothetical protein CPB84DRAFT_1758891 [Gymnopilus junonius]